MVWAIFKRRAGAAAPVSVLAGRYRLGQRLGGGAAGSQVHEAQDLRTGLSVAVKLSPLPPDLDIAQRADWLARMQREVNVSRRLAHPDIVALLDAGMGADQAWLVLERVHGQDLTRYAQPNRLLPEPVVLAVAARVAGALAHAHAKGVVHRDLKPSNVLVDLPNDTVKLADFGVARADDHHATRTGMTVGTPAYMAPEQLAGAPATPESDTYALGVLVFELLTARRPHQAATLGALLQAVASAPAPSLKLLRPDLPPMVIAAVDQLLQSDPARRPSDLTPWAAQTASLGKALARVMSPPNSAALPV